MATDIDHISVCICTYKRPQLLNNLLQALQFQDTNNLFSYEAVVVDNDVNKTAQEIVLNFCKSSVIRVDYYNEQEQNISLARNKAIENARGNYIAFIDDDEFPVSEWLLKLYISIHQFNSDGVLGPVKPYYPEGTPLWLIKSKLCDRPEHKTGEVMHWRDTRTGNVILKKSIFENKENRFGQEFGRTGGEDIEFFKKMITEGKVFVWCNEALTYETVPQERWSKTFYNQKFLRIGGLIGEKVRQRESNMYCIYFLIKSIAWIIIMLLSMPLAMLLGTHFFMRAMTKIMYNVGAITGFCGRTIIRFRQI